MWLGTGKHFLAFPVRAGTIDQLCRLRAGRRGDEGVVVGARRSRRRCAREFAGWDPRIGELLRHVQTTFRWALYDREPLPTWTNGRLTPARRRRASDAAASRTGRQPVDRGRHGARDDPGARRPRRPRRPPCSPTRNCAASASRRCSAARARTACATTRPIRISACATPRSPRTRRSAGGSTITTWCRTRRRRRGAARVELLRRKRPAPPQPAPPRRRSRRRAPSGGSA